MACTSARSVLRMRNRSFTQTLLSCGLLFNSAAEVANYSLTDYQTIPTINYIGRYVKFKNLSWPVSVVSTIGAAVIVC